MSEGHLTVFGAQCVLGTVETHSDSLRHSAHFCPIFATLVQVWRDHAIPGKGMATSCVTLENCTEMLNGTQLQVTYFEICIGFVHYVAMQFENCWSGKLHVEFLIIFCSQLVQALQALIMRHKKPHLLP